MLYRRAWQKTFAAVLNYEDLSSVARAIEAMDGEFIGANRVTVRQCMSVYSFIFMM